MLSAACATRQDDAACLTVPLEEPVPAAQPQILVLTFAGDIMSHSVNFEMRDYSRIYDDIWPLLASDDISFANYEAPIHDGRPLSTYPLFNTHSAYLKAAIDGGFDAFSLANNHSNDQGAEGIARTRAAIAPFTPLVAFSGLRENKDEPMHPQIIKKNGWTVLYLAVTEILNSYDSAGKLVYCIPQTEQGRIDFLASLATMRAENPCDLFVLSLHSGEAEYGRSVSDAKKSWYAEIERAGVDILWAHHPHVMQDWALSNADGRTVLTMYSMGNFVSGQRYNVNLQDPGAYREYTGDSVLVRVSVTRMQGATGYETLTADAIPLTNWNDPAGGVVVRRFTQSFVDGLSPVWKQYYLERYRLLRAYLPSLPVMP